MNSILILYFDLIRLRRGPQDIPTSQGLLLVTGFFLIATAMIGDQFNADFSGRLIFAVSQVAILSSVVWVILTLNQKSERAVQTLTAFYGSSVLLQLAVWPFRSWLLALTEEAQQQATIPLLAVVALAVWSFIVMVHIYRNALECSRGKAILTSVITQLIVGMSMLMLFANQLQLELAK